MMKLAKGDKKAMARNRFSSLRAVQESTGSTRSDNLSGAMKLSERSGSNEFVWDQETDTEALQLEKQGRTINVLSTSKQKAEMEKMNALTSNRIRYSTLEGTLYGRDEEKALLNSYLEEILPTAAPVENAEPEGQQPIGPRHSLILVKGTSGIGKSSLVATLKNPVMKKHKGLYVQGKFDLFLQDAQPYYGIATACREVCREISGLNGKSFAELQGQLKTQLGHNLHVLTNVIPELHSIVFTGIPPSIGSVRRGATDRRNNIQFSERSSNRSLTTFSSANTDHAATASGDKAKQNRDKILYAFRGFFRIVAAYFSPFVLVLDDLQWADVASLELVQSLLTDRENNQSFLIVGLFRSDEVEMDTGFGRHILTTTINNLREKANDKEVQLVIRELDVGNLNLQAVKSVTMDLLSLDDTPKAHELAELCHKRTLGNVFFLISFIAMLEEEGYLTYDLNSGTYNWDLEEIKNETGAASNVVSLVNQRMSKLPEDYALLLSLAACIGASFDSAKLDIIWTGYGKRFAPEVLHDCMGLSDRLPVAVQDGYLESFDNVKFRWIHDRVQEAALTLIPDEEVSQFKYRIGEILLRELSEEDLDASIFLVANLLNEGTTSTLQEDQRIQLAELNLGATQKAVTFSAFSSAAKYAATGIGLLPPDCWTNHYRLALELFSYAVEASDFVGDHDQMQAYCDVVLKLDDATCPIRDKLRVYYVLGYSLSNAGNNLQAVDLIHGVLAKLGCKFPKTAAGRLFATLAGFLRLQSALKSKKKEDIAAMSDMTDERHVEIMMLLHKFCMYTYICGSDLCGLSVVKGIKMTLKHGLCEWSPGFISSFCTVCCGVLNDPQGATKIGEDALVLLSKLNSRATLANTKFVVAAIAFPWTKPFSNVLPLLLEAYQDGMSTGDSESAGYAMGMYTLLSFMSGRSLKLVEADCAVYSKQMQEMNRQQGADFMAILLQVTRNLMGDANDPCVIQGDVILDAEKFRELYKENKPVMGILTSHSLRLYATFGQHEKGADLFLVSGFDFPMQSPGHPLFMHTVFYGGLSCFEMARSGKKRAYKKQALKARATIKTWLKLKNPNVKHFEALLDAENAALGGKKKAKVAEQLYQFSIAMAARGGFTQDAALANERYGEFILLVRSDKDDARYYFEQAIKFYSDWGATKKVEMLQHQYKDILQ